MPGRTATANGHLDNASETHEELQARLSRIEGHVRGIKKMLAEQRDCDAIMMQIVGVKAAINQVAVQLLERHLEDCLTEALGNEGSPDSINRFKDSLSWVVK